MTLKIHRIRRAVPLALVLGVVGLAGCRPGSDEPPRAYELVELPAGLDTLSTLGTAADRVEECTHECLEVLYLWSPRMPLSRSGIPNVHQATTAVGAGLTLLAFEDVDRYAESETEAVGRAGGLAGSLLASGALTHAPSLVIYRNGEVLGPAIVGYKTSEAYTWMIERRLDASPGETGTSRQSPPPVQPASLDGLPSERRDRPVGVASTPFEQVVDPSPGSAYRDYEAVGVPGAYFKWVPGRGALAYESGGRVYVLDLETGMNRVAPGTIDFVPSPDGRYFVTPGSRESGLMFFDADEVFDAVATGRTGDAQPFFTDARMRDQYPSVGILASDGAAVLYRVLTSWFEGVVYRDYAVTRGEGGTQASVAPIGDPVVPCEGFELSTPIMSQDGTEVAARDEASGTTKIFRFLPERRCEVVDDLGMPTRKVAWHASGRKLAFSTPRLGRVESGGAERIFVYDRDSGDLTRVSGSEGASRLAFPDFVGEDAIVFMMPGRSVEEASAFRLVEPLP